MMAPAHTDAHRWFEARRLDYIDWRLSTRGEIQRADISLTFGVSEACASGDLNEFLRLYPVALTYDKSRKRYVPARSPYRRQRNDGWSRAINWDHVNS